MKLAKSSAERIENFFKEYLEDENFVLPKINFYCGKFTNILTKLLKIHGITFGGYIFILPSLLRKNSERKNKLPEDLVVHEIAHVLQYKRDGFVKFLYKYLRDYRHNLQKRKTRDEISKHLAYRDIPYEIEAREIAEKFCNWNLNLKSENCRLR
ncbi:MAG TPA: hypothetical protein PKY59_01255 [Pyrinomonadaceae bacterium]|nr:hypothetical protein [Pyrinomonadaceae bacterium]